MGRLSRAAPGSGLIRVAPGSEPCRHHRDTQRLERDLVLETMILNMPEENYERMFATFVSWARVGDLFAYDEARQTLSLP